MDGILLTDGIVSYSITENLDSSLTAVSHRRPLVPPGGTRTVRIEHTTSRVVLAAALFTDGSHEGDSGAAAQLKSGQIGYEIQKTHALPIIDRIIKAPAINDDIRLAQIKDELSRLSNSQKIEPYRKCGRNSQIYLRTLSEKILQMRSIRQGEPMVRVVWLHA